MARVWTCISMVIVLLASACAGSKPRQTMAGPADAAGEAPSPAAQPRSGPDFGAGAPAPEAATRSEQRAAESEADVFEPAPSARRPGLATSWGEQRDSRVSEVSFVRDGSHPFGLVAIRYDDETGIRAATGRGLGLSHSGVFPVNGGAFTISVVDDDGDPLPALFASGRNYVFGERGDRYAIRIQNHTPGRFEVVATVDGLDVIDGRDGSTSKRGYIVAPWGTLDIEGFRDDWDTVRAFRFGAVDESYAVARGKGQNVGVIGVALFAERGFRFPARDELRRRRDADPFPGRFAPAPYAE